MYFTDTATWLVYRTMAWLSDVAFDHFIPLDGRAYPLVSQAVLRSELAVAAVHGSTSLQFHVAVGPLMEVAAWPGRRHQASTC